MLTQLLPSTLSLRPLPAKILSLTPTRTHFPTHLPWAPPHRFLPPIRMGGGPRTFPGGVSKWQWKRMQAKKAKQLLKARLLRERQVYEMRKRAELKAAVSELEKPWELVERAPALFSVAADEQVKALADRFQKPGGFDMWSDRDGPQVFVKRDDGSLLPSRRFFPKGVVHSVRPYAAVEEEEEEEEVGFDDWIARGGGGVRRRRRRDGRQGVRSNADERVDGELECIDVETRVLGGENEGDGEMGRLSLGGNRKNLERSRWRGGSRNEKITLRPTSDLRFEGGGSRLRGSKWKDGDGVRRNQGRREQST